MSLKDNFKNPKGLTGRLMVTTMNWGHSPMAKWGFTQFELPEKAHILDIGSGGGYNLKRFLAACPYGKVFGVDISEESVKKSVAVNKKEIGRRCEVVQGSVEKLPFKDDMFDLSLIHI